MSFIVSAVSDEKELAEIYRLRYKVYCLEWGFEKPEKHPNGLETDEYDRYSVHFAVRDDSQKIVGSVRLILNPPEGFPLERYCHIDMDTGKIPRENIAEISRLVISRDYRKRSEDKYIYGPDEERRTIGSFETYNRGYYRRTEDRFRHRQPGALRLKNGTQNDRRSRHELVTCLYKAVYHESKRRQLTHWYAVMTKGLVIMLKKFGIKFQALGDPVDFHGIRTPYIGEIRKIEEEVMKEHPEIYEEFTKNL